MVTVTLLTPLQGISFAAENLDVPLQDLPKITTEYIVLRHLLRTFARLQHKIISDHLIEKNLRQDRADPLFALLEEAKWYESFTSTKNGKISLKNTTILNEANMLASLSKRLDVKVANLTRLASRVAVLEGQVSESDCPKIRVLNKKSISAERHNFIAYYVKYIQNLCSKVVDWAPNYTDEINKALYVAFFSENGRIDREHLWPSLHRYLSTPDNNTFPIENNIFLALYFQYLELAEKSRFVSFILNEFIVF